MAPQFCSLVYFYEDRGGIVPSGVARTTGAINTASSPAVGFRVGYDQLPTVIAMMLFVNVFRIIASKPCQSPYFAFILS